MKLRIVKSGDENVELEHFLETQKQLAEAQQAHRMASQALMERMTREQRKSYTKEDGGKRYRVTYVQNMRTQINEAGLKKAMGAVAFRKICKQVVDRKALEEALTQGTADPNVVGQYLIEVPSAPFIKFTEGNAADDSAGTE